MTVRSTSTPHDHAAARDVWQAMGRGLVGKCPRCGVGGVFARLLTVQPQCPQCGEALHHHRADDLPPYLNVFIVGHVVVGLLALVMVHTELDTWTITFGGAGFAVVMAVLLMRPIKGAVVGAQWALRMHGFGGHDD